MTGVIRAAVLGLACLALAAYVYVALRRMTYPYDLEWIETAILQHVERVEDGRPLYDEPSVDWVALIYAPLYYFACAALTPVFDTGLPLLRGVSFAASLGCMGLAFALVRRETGSNVAGLVAVGLFAAVFDQVGGWFDLARVDSLFVFLMMAAIYVARYARSARGALAAGVLLVLAVYTKQQALVVLPALLVYFLVGRRDRRLALAFGAISVAGLVAIYVAAELATDGWFSYYFSEVGGQHPYEKDYLLWFFTSDMGPVIPALVLAALAVWRWRAAGDRERLAFYVPLALAIGLGSYLSRIHAGGYDNVVIPTYLIVAILAGIALAPLGSRAFVAAGALVVVQFGLLAYNPGTHIPSDDDRRRTERAIAAIRALPGDVYVPSYPIYARHAGKREYVHTAAALDIQRADDTEGRRGFRRSFDGALAEHCFSHIVAIGFGSDHYRRLRPLLPGESVRPISGLQVPLGDVYVPTEPRRASPAPTGRATRCRTARSPAAAPGGG